MLRAARLAKVGVCAAIALLMTTTPARAQDFTTWLFAEGSTSGLLGFEKELLLANPNTSAVTVTIAAFTQDGEAIAPFTLSVEPLSRAGVNVRSIPGVGDRAGIALRVTRDGADHRRAHHVLGRRPVPRRSVVDQPGQRHARRPQREGRRRRRPTPGTSPRAKASSSTPSSRWPTRTTSPPASAPPTSTIAATRTRRKTSSRPTPAAPSGPRRSSARASRPARPALPRSSSRSTMPWGARPSRSSSPSARCTGVRAHRSASAAATRRWASRRRRRSGSSPRVSRAAR